MPLLSLLQAEEFMPLLRLPPLYLTTPAIMLVDDLKNKYYGNQS